LCYKLEKFDSAQLFKVYLKLGNLAWAELNFSSYKPKLGSICLIPVIVDFGVT